MSSNDMVPKSDAPSPVESHAAVTVTAPPIVPPKKVIVIEFGGLRVHHEQAPERSPSDAHAARTYRFFCAGMAALTLVFVVAVNKPWGIAVALAFAFALFAWANQFYDHRQ